MDPYGYGYGANPYFGQKPPAPPPLAKGPPAGFNYGWNTPGMPGMGAFAPRVDQFAGQWVPPPPAPHAGHSGFGFLKKTRGGNGGNRGGLKRPFPQAKKAFDPTGKSPAMLMHELFKEVQEKYEEIPSGPMKSYRCTLTVEGTTCFMVAVSKKVAKQKASELILRSLRPDINVTPYEETTAGQPAAKKEPVDFADTQRPKYEAPPLMPHTAPPQLAVAAPQPRSSGQQGKKAKVPALSSALSILDALRKLCLENGTDEVPYSPNFTFDEVQEEPAGGDSRLGKKYKCMLTFPDQGHIFVSEGIGRNSPKELVCLQALKELFGVTDLQIREIMRRHVLGKGGDMPIVQTLYHVAKMCHCEIEFKPEQVEALMGVGTGKHQGFTCELTLTDHTRGSEKFVFSSGVHQSKHDAKEEASLKALKEHFDISPVNNDKEGVPTPNPPCQQLSVLCAKVFKKNDVVSFEDMGSVGVQNSAGFGFKCKCKVRDHEFVAIGNSKKAAKNAAALLAMNALFPSGGKSAPQLSMVSEKCNMFFTYVKSEYDYLVNFYNIQPSSNVACFLFVNERDEKRLISIASAPPGPISTQAALGADGTCLYHYDPIVLARRSFVKYITNQLLEAKDQPNCLFDKGEDGMFKLKDNLRVVLYANFPPSVNFSNPDAADRCLSVIGPRGIEVVGSNEMTMEDVRISQVIRVHSPADKIFKWTHLGIQGSLLSTVMHPILLDNIYFGVSSPFGDSALKHSFYDRVRPVTRPVTVESAQKELPRLVSPPHIYTRDIRNIELLNPTGRTDNGAPSRCCKASLYEDYLKLVPELPRDTPYLDAKARAIVYNQSKKIVYDQLENSGYGMWQKKPAELVNFTLSGFQ